MSMQTSVLMPIASGLVYESKQAISQSLFTGPRISRCMCVCVFPIPSHLVVRVLRLEGEGAELHVPLRVGVGVRAPREVAAAHVHAPDVVLETRGREVGAAGWNIPYKKTGLSRGLQMKIIWQMKVCSVKVPYEGQVSIQERPESEV